MSILAEKSPVIEKTRELCAQIASDTTFIQLQGNVERFLNDEPARLQYQSVHERGEELHNKQHAGVELGQAEIKEFEAARDSLLENEIVREFLTAQKELESLQKEIGRYVGMTLELGRVPTDEELENAGGGGGCCGGSGDGGDGGGCCSN